MIAGIPRTWDVLEACVAPGWPDSGGYKEMGHPPETFSGHWAFASGEFWFGKTDGYTPQSADFLAWNYTYDGFYWNFTGKGDASMK